MSIPIGRGNGAFNRKRSSNRRNLNLALPFPVDGKRFDYGAFRKRCYVISVTEFSLNTCNLNADRFPNKYLLRAEKSDWLR